MKLTGASSESGKVLNTASDVRGSSAFRSLSHAVEFGSRVTSSSLPTPVSSS